MTTWKTVTLLGLAITAVATAASAQHRVSGTITRTYTIVETTELVGDVTCAVTAGPCFAFGAHDVELRIGGFRITGPADPITGCGGASVASEPGISTAGSRNVTVRGPGLIERFRGDGIFVTGSTGARVELVTVSTNCMSGIRVASNAFDTTVQDNIAVRNGSSMPGFPCGGI
jgi:hypothetical protein